MRYLTLAELQAELSVAADALLNTKKHRGRVRAAAQMAKATRRVRATPTPGQRFIYVIGAPGQSVKVGVAKDVRKRRRSLQTASSAQLALHFAALCPMGFELEIEREAHRALRRFRLEGEWFDVLPGHAEIVISEIVARYERTT